MNIYMYKMLVFKDSWVSLNWRSRSKMILFQLHPMTLFKNGDHNDNAGDDSENRNNMR